MVKPRKDLLLVLQSKTVGEVRKLPVVLRGRGLVAVATLSSQNLQDNNQDKCPAMTLTWTFQVFLKNQVKCPLKLEAPIVRSLAAEPTLKTVNKPFQIYLKVVQNKTALPFTKKKAVESLKMNQLATPLRKATTPLPKEPSNTELRSWQLLFKLILSVKTTLQFHNLKQCSELARKHWIQISKIM